MLRGRLTSSDIRVPPTKVLKLSVTESKPSVEESGKYGSNDHSSSSRFNSADVDCKLMG